MKDAAVPLGSSIDDAKSGVIRGKLNRIVQYVEEGAFHGSRLYDKPTSMISLCQVGQGFPIALRRAPGCFTERIHHFAVVPLGAVPARNAEPDIHSLYRAVETVTED